VRGEKTTYFVGSEMPALPAQILMLLFTRWCFYRVSNDYAAPLFPPLLNEEGLIRFSDMPQTPSRAILTDIEGTTSSLSFVRDILFPYARCALPEFVRVHGNKPEVRHWLDTVATEISAAACQDEVIVETLQGWIDQDRKHTALKALQGMIWETGYRNGDYRAHLYPDVAMQLRTWHTAGTLLYVYSSGSIAAQKLFFQYSQAGDLSGLFCGHFDTEIGHKREIESYRRIAQTIGLAPGDILFLSDVVEELDAAREAGLDTVLIDRLNDYPAPRQGAAANGHQRVTGFDGLSKQD